MSRVEALTQVILEEVNHNAQSLIALALEELDELQKR